MKITRTIEVSYSKSASHLLDGYHTETVQFEAPIDLNGLFQDEDFRNDIQELLARYVQDKIGREPSAGVIGQFLEAQRPTTIALEDTNPGEPSHYFQVTSKIKYSV